MRATIDRCIYLFVARAKVHLSGKRVDDRKIGYMSLLLMEPEIFLKSMHSHTLANGANKSKWRNIKKYIVLVYNL